MRGERASYFLIRTGLVARVATDFRKLFLLYLSSYFFKKKWQVWQPSLEPPQSLGSRLPEGVATIWHQWQKPSGLQSTDELNQALVESPPVDSIVGPPVAVWAKCGNV